MFQEYPKILHHPQHAAPVMKKLEGKGVGLFEPDTICTTPEKFPDVTVTDLNQEQYYAARGYRPNNMADPVAYEQAILESAPVAGYVNTAYPKWKYHAMAIPVIVKSVAEEAELGDDWEDAPIIATEDDLIEHEESGGDDEEGAVETKSAPKSPTKPRKPAAKAAKKAPVDKRSKAYRDAHKSQHA